MTESSKGRSRLDQLTQDRIRERGASENGAHSAGQTISLSQAECAMHAATPDAALESRVRRKASRLGYRVHKSRAREHCNQQGGYMLIETVRNFAALGINYDASLDEIESFLSDD